MVVSDVIYANKEMYPCICRLAVFMQFRINWKHQLRRATGTILEFRVTLFTGCVIGVCCTISVQTALNDISLGFGSAALIFFSN